MNKAGKDDKNRTLKRYHKSDLIYSSKYNFYVYHDINKFNKHCFESNYAHLIVLYIELNEFSRLKSM